MVRRQARPGHAGGAALVVLDGAVGRATLPRADALPAACSQRSTIIVAMLQAAALGLRRRRRDRTGRAGQRRPLPACILLAVAAAAFFWAFLYPGTRWVRSLRAGDARAAARRAAGGALHAPVAFCRGRDPAVDGLGGAAEPAASDLHEPFAALNGASAWPSQLLRTLAIVLFAWFLDYAWCRAAQEADVVGDKYFPAQGRRAGRRAGGRRTRPEFAAARVRDLPRRHDLAVAAQGRRCPKRDGAIDGSRAVARIPARPARLATAGAHRLVGADHHRR